MKTHVGKAKEETGQAPACTGALLKIKRISRVYIKAGESEWSKEFAGCAQYLVNFGIEKPAAAAGCLVTDRIRVGTPEDKEAQKKATWEVSEGGPARLNRLLTRSGTALTADDEEWGAGAVGRTVVAPITHNKNGYVNVGLYYRETDKDCPVIGLAGAKVAGARKPVAAEEDDDEDETPPAKPAEVDEEAEDDDEEEAPPKAAKGKDKKKPKPADDDEDDDDE